MADDADNAAEHIERDLAYRLSIRKEVPRPTNGHCLYCDEPVEVNVRFCCKDCCKDWDEEQAIRAKQFKRN